MWQRRYPYAPAGRLAAPLFGVAGLIAGVASGVRDASGPGVVVSGGGWMCLAATVAFLIYSSEGPKRPPSIRQACAADGVVVGILAGVIGVVLFVIAGRNLSPGQGVVGAVSGFAGGGLIGGLLGLVLVAVAGEDRMMRLRPPGKKKRTGIGRSAKKRRR